MTKNIEFKGDLESVSLNKLSHTRFYRRIPIIVSIFKYSVVRVYLFFVVSFD